MDNILLQQELENFINNFKKDHSPWIFNNNKISLDVIYRNVCKDQLFYLTDELEKNIKKDIEKYNTYHIAIVNDEEYDALPLDNTYYCYSFAQAKQMIEYFYDNLELYSNDFTKDALNSQTIIVS